MSNDIPLNDSNLQNIIKKEARGYNDEELGEVQEVKDNYIVVQKGIINKEKFYIPKYKVEGYDGNVLKLRLSEINLNQYKEDSLTNQDFEKNLKEAKKEKEEIAVNNADFKYKKVSVKDKEEEEQKVIDDVLLSQNSIEKPEDIIKEEARGLGAEAYLGEVQEISKEHIVTEKGTIDKEKYKIPKNLVKQFDDKNGTLYFNVTKEEAEQYKKD
jgi:arsenate reductase-like glutaredoxin family protein